MKKYMIITLLITALISRANAQDNSAASPDETRNIHWEIGLPLISHSNQIYYGGFMNSNTEYVNGIFVRATHGRFGVRVLAKYSQYTHDSPPCVGCNDYLYVTENAKVFQAEGGFQFSILRKPHLLYAFSDFNYQNIFKRGSEDGGFAGVSNDYTHSINAYGFTIGAGSRIRLWRTLYLSPEAGFSKKWSYTHVNSTSRITHQNNIYDYTDKQHGLYARLLLSVGF